MDSKTVWIPEICNENWYGIFKNLEFSFPVTTISLFTRQRQYEHFVSYNSHKLPGTRLCTADVIAIWKLRNQTRLSEMVKENAATFQLSDCHVPGAKMHDGRIVNSGTQ